MKISVNNRVSKVIMRQADEIRVRTKDINQILDFIEEFPKKTIVYLMDKEIFKEDDKIWKTLQMYNDKLDNFIIEVKDGRDIEPLKAQGFQVAWNYPVNTYADLRALIALSPAYILIGEPLTFELSKVKNLTKDIPLHMVANLAYYNYIPRENGLYGDWIRPEDIPVYNSYIDTISFWAKDKDQEEILFKTYKNQTWPGNLNFLIVNLNLNLDNRAMPDDFGKRRCNCGQICQNSGNCHYCQNAVMFNKLIRTKADEKRLKDKT